MKSSTFINLGVSLCIILLSGCRNLGPKGPGTLIGWVKTSTGNPVSGASILTEPGTIDTITNNSGYFSIPNISEGDYTITASKNNKTASKSIFVKGEDTTTVNLEFQISWSIHTQFSTDITLKSVWFLNEDEGWTVGYDGDENGYTYHWDGSKWTKEIVPTGTPSLYAISGTATNNVWAVGKSGTCLHWDGIRWYDKNDEIIGNTDLLCISCPSDSDVWIGGKDGKIFHFDGSNWIKAELNAKDIEGISFTSTNDGWVVDCDGRVFHWTEYAWVLIGDIFNNDDAYSIFFISSTKGWIAGVADGKGFVGNYDGENWTQDKINGTSCLYSIYTISASNLWAVGKNGNICHSDGTNWQVITSPTNNTLYSIHMLSSVSGWAVGEKGIILKYQ